DPNEFANQKWALAAVELNTGRVIWQKDNLEARTFLSDELLRCSSNAIPLVALLPQGTRNGLAPRSDVVATPTTGSIEMTVVDKKTGQTIGEPIETSLGTDTGASRIQNVEVWPGRILVVSGSSY